MIIILYSSAVCSLDGKKIFIGTMLIYLKILIFLGCYSGKFYILNGFSGCILHIFESPFKGQFKSIPYIDPFTNLIWVCVIKNELINKIKVGCYDNYLYVLNDEATCIWKFQTSKPIFSSPIKDNKRKFHKYFKYLFINNYKSQLYVGGLDGYFYCFYLICHNYNISTNNVAKLQWKIFFDKPIFSSPAINEDTGNVFFGELKMLFEIFYD